MKLDYTVKDPRERVACVEEALKEGDPGPAALSYMADYLLFAAEPGTTRGERSQEYPIVTRNREATVSKRQVSYDEISEGDDCAVAVANDKDQIMDPRDPIAPEDIDEVPGMREKAELAADLRRQVACATGRRRYLLKRQLIDTCREQYVLKAAWRGGARVLSPRALPPSPSLPDEEVWVDADGYPHARPGCASFLDPSFAAAALRSYTRVRFPASGEVGSDASLAAMELQGLLRRALRDEPLLYDVALMKMCGFSNEEVAREVRARHGVSHFHRYYSTLWCRRIPKLVARRAQEEWVLRHASEMGWDSYKVCPRCGRRKLAHPMFFSRNSSADGYYSICKRCRSK